MDFEQVESAQLLSRQWVVDGPVMVLPYTDADMAQASANLQQDAVGLIDDGGAGLCSLSYQQVATKGGVALAQAVLGLHVVDRREALHGQC